MAATTSTDNLPAMQSGARVAAIVPTNFNEVVQIAGAIVRAKMAPRGYEGDTEKATVAILAGMEVGFTPFAALQSIAVINGTPSIFGDGLVALVRGSGLLEDMEEGLTVDKQGIPEIAWCKVKRKGEKTWHERSLTMAECHRAGWAKKPGPWTLTPGRMMTIRVRGWLYRDVFADVLKGLKSAEEVQDMVDITPKPEAPPEPQRSDYVEQPSTAATPTADPPKDAAPPDAPAPEGSGAAVTDVEDLSETPLTFENYPRAGDFFIFADAWIGDEKRTEAELVAFGAFYADYMNERLDKNFKSKAVREAMVDTDGLLKKALAQFKAE